MRKLPLSVAIAVMTLAAGSTAPTQAQQTVGQDVGSVVDAVNPFQSSGCYRWGTTGYHWYKTCVGPRVIYQHQRYCTSNGQCYYR
jgi:hypothetical protein